LPAKSLNLTNRTQLPPHMKHPKIPMFLTLAGGDAISPRNDEPTPTILGNLRVNPFTTAVMTQAWGNVTGQNLPALLPATHYYVKFLPATLEQFKKLDETSLVLFDYPLEYEVVQMGDYYADPAVPEGGIPPLYAVVKTDDYPPIFRTKSKRNCCWHQATAIW